MMGKKHTKWLEHQRWSIENGTWYRQTLSGTREVQAGCRYEEDIFL